MFDLGVILITGISAAFACLRGFLREAATVLALALAVAGGMATGLFSPAAESSTRDILLMVSGALLLVAVLFFVLDAAFGYGLKRIPFDRRFRTGDRIAGGIFGLVRGLLVAGLWYLGWIFFLGQDSRPPGEQAALTRPLVSSIARRLENAFPALPETQALPDPYADPSTEGYGRKDRSALSEIVVTATTGTGTTGTGTQPLSVPAGEQEKTDPVPAQESNRQ